MIPEIEAAMVAALFEGFAVFDDAVDALRVWNGV